MFHSSQASSASSLNSFVEGDGCARSVLVILLLTTVGCMSYTWGYYEVRGAADRILHIVVSLNTRQQVQNAIACINLCLAQGITNVNSMIVLDELHRNAEMNQVASVEMERDLSGVMGPSTGSLLKGTNTSIWSNSMRAKLAASKNATGSGKARGNGTRLSGVEPKSSRDNHKRARHQVQQAERQAATTER